MSNGETMKVWLVAGHGDEEGTGKVFRTYQAAMEHAIKVAYDKWELGGPIKAYNRTTHMFDDAEPISFATFRDGIMSMCQEEPEEDWGFYMWSGGDKIASAVPGFVDILSDSWWSVTRVDFENI